MTRNSFFAFFLFGVVAAAIACCQSLPTRGDHLANDVRYVHEYALALKEGQRPPLVAPTLDDVRRPPVFQYYSGTAYTIPGLLARRGVDSAVALRVSVFAHALAAGWFVYASCRVVGPGAAASALAGAVAGVTYQALAFVLFHRLPPATYADFTAWAVAPLIFYLGLRALRATRRWDRRRWLCLMALALAYFIPLQPVHAIMSGCVVLALLTAGALFHARTRRAGPVRLLAAVACGAAASAWFWWPLVRDRGAIPQTLAASLAGHVAPGGPDEAKANLVRPDGTLDVNASPLMRLRDRRHARYWTELPPGREGQYQLPVYSLPSAEVLVNGRRVYQPPPPVGRPMVVVPLRAGANFITIRTRPAAAAWRISVAACVTLIVAALLAAFVARPMPSVSVRHL